MSTPGGHGANETRKATINGLAVVGFGALILGGALLALYAARYVPDALSRLTSAVYLSADKPEDTDTPAPEGGGGFVLFPSAEDRTPEEPEEESTPPEPVADESDEDTPVTGGPLYTPPPPTVSPPVYYYPPREPSLYGLPDLELFDVRAGYFRGSTFIEDNDVPENRDAGVKFMVINTGTNIVSGWRVLVETTGERDAIAYGGALRPDGYQTFTLRITDSDEDTLRISIEVDPGDRIDESNERNNDDTVRLDLDQ